ncbi:MAG: integrase family protein, partial [Alphaproteobacteria bacterium]|nr:integrase family protein [Alphaproteobacteria bacterium]
MAKHILTERRLKRLRPGHAGKPYDVMDAAIPGFGVRVLASGRRTFVLIGRFPGGRNPTRRALGVHGVLSVHEARQKARTWLLLLEKGIDPREEAERARREQMRQRENAFGRVAEEYIAHAVLGPDPARPKQRKGVALAREIRQEFIARSGWAERPITQITGQDVLGVIDQAVARGAPYQAHNLLGAIRRLFNWAIARQVYGLERSPCDRMRPREIIGPKALRTRTLNDRELCALWQGCERLGYPYGPLFKFLALTGQRRSEVGEARWREFDLERELWIIPAERMKM